MFSDTAALAYCAIVFVKVSWSHGVSKDLWVGRVLFIHSLRSKPQNSNDYRNGGNSYFLQRLQNCLNLEFQVTTVWKRGIDCAGPLCFKENVNKNNTISKYYVLLLTSDVTGEVYLKLTPDVGAHSLLLALRKFISRNGTKCIYFWQH